MKIFETVLHLQSNPAMLLTLRATVVILLALAAAALLRRSRASLRHGLFATLFIVLLALPLAPRVIPRVEVPIPVTTVERSGPEASSMIAQTQQNAAAPEQPRTIAIGWRELYFAIVVVLLASLARGVLRLWRLAARGTVWLDGTRLAAEVGCDHGIRRAVLVVLSEAETPMTFGFRRSTILLPSDARDWDDESLRRALRHELEHVRREDWILQLVARVACALYWPHPLVWAAWRRFCIEAERSCDDAVIAAFEPSRYAEQLVSLARSFRARRVPALSMASPTRLAERVHAILDATQPRGPQGPIAQCASVVAVVIAVGAFGSLHLIAAEEAQARPAPKPADRVQATSGDAIEDGVEGALAAYRDEIVEAAASGDLTRIQWFLDRGFNVNHPLAGDGTVLLIAARRGHAAAVELLLDHGADPNVPSPGDGNALIAAAAANQVKVIDLLLRRGANVDAVVHGDETALITAARRGSADAARLLIDRGADVNARVFVTFSDDGSEWRTALKMARRARSATIEKMLLDAGARE